MDTDVHKVLTGQQVYCILQGDWIDRLKELPDGCVQCLVTSPPYWGQRNYGVEGQLGLETTPDCGLQGFMRLRKDLSKDELLYVIQQLLAEDVYDEHYDGTKDTK